MASSEFRNEYFKVVVVAMREGDLERLPDEVQELVEDALASGYDVRSSYSGHPHEWIPFKDEEGKTVHELIDEVGDSLPGVRFVPRTVELFEAVGNGDEEVVIEITDDWCIYVFDCLSLEHPEVQRVAVEVDKGSYLAACLFPICKTYPGRLRGRAEATRASVLPRIQARYESRGSYWIRANVLDAIEFCNDLRMIVFVLGASRFRMEGAGAPPPQRREEIESLHRSGLSVGRIEHPRFFGGAS